LSEVLDKLSELEARVAVLKDWKQKYEEAERQWREEKKRLEDKLANAEKLSQGLRDFLGVGQSVASPSQSKEVSLTHKELVVNLTHEEKELNMTTSTVNGKILYCALTELPKEGFSEVELSDVLKEHGWNVPHNTLAPNLGGLARDGTLVRVEGSKPMKYRLPRKVKLNVRLMELAKG